MQFSFSIISQLVVIIYLDIILLLILFISHLSFRTKGPSFLIYHFSFLIWNFIRHQTKEIPSGML